MKRSKNKVFIYVLLVLLVVSFVSAVPPVDTIFTGDTGIQIEVNIMPYYKYGEARWSVIHLFNVTDGFIITNATHTNVSCMINLRDSQGFELMVVEATVHGDHWDLNGSGGGANPVGNYAWTLHCLDYNAHIGGYTSGYFEITESGIEEPMQDRTSGVTVLIFVLIITAALFYASSEKFFKGDALNFAMQGAFFMAGLGMLILDNAVIMTIADKANLGVQNELTMILRILTIALQITLYVVFGVYWFMLVHKIKEGKQQRRLGL